MLQAKKEALQNTARQKLVEIRGMELAYYTSNCRNIGNMAAIVAGLAYSGIRYHYLLERNTNFNLELENSIEEMVFLSLLAITIGFALQTVYVSMLVALFGPQLALRGPDGSLHDAVEGMHKWNSVVLALFFTSLILLQLSAFSFMYGHSSLNLFQRLFLCASITASIAASVHYARVLMIRLRVPKDVRVTGAFFRDDRYALDGFTDAGVEMAAAAQEAEARAAATGRHLGVQPVKLCSSRAPARPGLDATRIADDALKPLTAEALDAALLKVQPGGLAAAEGGAALSPKSEGGNMLHPAFIAQALKAVPYDQDEDDDEVNGHVRRLMSSARRGGGGGGGDVESEEEEDYEDAPFMMSREEHRQQQQDGQRGGGRQAAWRRQAKRRAAKAAANNGGGGSEEVAGLLGGRYRPPPRPRRAREGADAWTVIKRMFGQEA